jgi:hypothetical protein
MALEALARDEDMLLRKLTTREVAGCGPRPSIVVVKLAMVLQEMVRREVLVNTTLLFIWTGLGEVVAGFADVCLLALALRTGRNDVSPKPTRAKGARVTRRKST